MTDYSNLLDTIAAVSTPRGKGGVALLRVSGPDALSISEKVFRTKSGKSMSDRPRFSFFGDIVFPETGKRAGEVIDTGLAVYYKGPNSFTGEDTVEICCHGGVLVTATVLTALLEAGARPAERGEFTRRSFASGKMSLPEAEALGLLLDAGTDAQLKLSRSGMSGALTESCNKLRQGITELLTDMYARIDFPEEDLGSIEDSEVKTRMEGLVSETEALMKTYKTGKAIAEGIDTVICGRTNTGKSTLYNRLSNSEDAIVTDIEGTTRDILSTTVSFGGATLRIYDTAGIRSGSGDTVENIGIDRAKNKIRDAELVFFLIDASRDPTRDDLDIAGSLEGHPGNVIAVLTKADSETVSEKALELFESFPMGEKISALTGMGMDALEKRVNGLFIDGSLDIGKDTVISSARQYTALGRVYDALRDAYTSHVDGFASDVVSVCLEEAATALGELDGRGHGSVSADVIEGIFSKFCVGK